MFEIDWKTPHLWRKTAPSGAGHPALKEDVTADIVVAGGGFTGLSTAIAAASTGLKVVLLEGNEIGSAASGRNNGLVISHHSKASPSEIEAAYGKTIGERYNGLVSTAAGTAFGLMEKYQIDGHQVRNGWIQPAHSEQAAARVRKFHDEWRAFGHDVEWFDGAEVSRRIGSRYVGGWMAKDSGHINPYATVCGFAAAAAGEGVAIYENSRVEAIEPDGKGWRLKTAQGSVRADQVVLATNALTGKFWPKLEQAIIPMQVFQAATAPVPPELRSKILIDNPAVSDTRRDIRAFHYDRDFRIVTGGTHTLWHNAKARGLAKAQKMLADAFPMLGPEPKVDEYWEGVFGAVPDRKPRLMRLAPGVVFAGIYSGRGVALSLTLGQKVGLWAAGKLEDADMPLPVTDLKLVPMHPVAVQVARHIHPWHRIKDRFS
ncbi:NAD(P)/FAD-dependent oxidoreductase [Ensifer soli]|uniref:NAD(P)/FAD-dependent oxidoreductase n=1 Tax=Ciceribacter sp. sgz301302 TaxID=3342379 RepID=UPI0035B9F540